MNITIQFGAIGPKISEQVSKLPLNRKPPMATMVTWDRLAAEICGLVIHGLLTDAERNRANKKLMAKIVREIRAVNEPKQSLLTSAATKTGGAK